MKGNTCHVLTETELAKVDTNLLQEELDTGQEVAESLVINNIILDSLADGHRPDLGGAGQLGIAIEKVHLNVLDLREAAVCFATLGVDKVLNLGHEELSHA